MNNIFIVLFPLALEPSLNFNILELAYSLTSIQIVNLTMYTSYYACILLILSHYSILKCIIFIFFINRNHCWVSFSGWNVPYNEALAHGNTSHGIYIYFKKFSCCPFIFAVHPFWQLAIARIWKGTIFHFYTISWNTC